MIKRKLALFLLKIIVKKAGKEKELKKESFVKRAYSDMIKSYNYTIMFLEAEIKSNKK